MEKRESVAAHQPVGVCEKLYNAFINRPSLIPLRRPRITSGGDAAAMAAAKEEAPATKLCPQGITSQGTESSPRSHIQLNGSNNPKMSKPCMSRNNLMVYSSHKLQNSSPSKDSKLNVHPQLKWLKRAKDEESQPVIHTGWGEQFWGGGEERAPSAINGVHSNVPQPVAPPNRKENLDTKIAIPTLPHNPQANLKDTNNAQSTAKPSAREFLASEREKLANLMQQRQEKQQPAAAPSSLAAPPQVKPAAPSLASAPPVKPAAPSLAAAPPLKPAASSLATAPPVKPAAPPVKKPAAPSLAAAPPVKPAAPSVPKAPTEKGKATPPSAPPSTPYITLKKPSEKDTKAAPTSPRAAAEIGKKAAQLAAKAETAQEKAMAAVSSIGEKSGKAAAPPTRAATRVSEKPESFIKRARDNIWGGGGGGNYGVSQKQN